MDWKTYAIGLCCANLPWTLLNGDANPTRELVPGVHDKMNVHVQQTIARYIGNKPV